MVQRFNYVLLYRVVLLMTTGQSRVHYQTNLYNVQWRGAIEALEARAPQTVWRLWLIV